MPTFSTKLLLRDGRLAWLQERGLTVNYRTLKPAELAKALRGKLLEEAQEAAEEQNPAELLKELADVQEVLFALADVHGFTKEDLAAMTAERNAKLGAFEKGYYSDSVTMPSGHDHEEYYRQHSVKYPEIKESA